MPDGSFTPAMAERVHELLVAFKLPTVNAELGRRLGEAGFGDAMPTVLEVLEAEAEARRQRRVDRLVRASQLPPGKTLEMLDVARLPKPLVTKVRELVAGEFLDRAVNVLCFGLPGVGKSHIAAAIGHEMVRRARSVYFAPTYEVVQNLLAAKRDLALPRALRRLDAFDLVILDDLGYVQQSPEEAEVLFTLVSERYERRSLLITSNLVFSEWERIFRNAMATAAAIDRLVHHAVILEFANVVTYRNPDADQPGSPIEPAPPKEKNDRRSRSRGKSKR
jgi:DNA replication protein DnaC